MGVKYFKVEGIIEIDENTELKDNNKDLLDVVTNAVLKGIEEEKAIFWGGVTEVDENGKTIKIN